MAGVVSLAFPLVCLGLTALIVRLAMKVGMTIGDALPARRSESPKAEKPPCPPS
jgi:hypothetical protein